jgi:hypothetical protein
VRCVSKPFSGENWTPAADACAFASSLSEIASGAAESGFVARRSLTLQSRLSFDVVASLMGYPFQLLAGVASVEISVFVARMEAAKQSGKWE